MDIKLNLDLSSVPTVSADIHGRVLYMNNEAMKIFPSLFIGKEIFDIIDRDIIMKISMFGKINIVETKSNKYNYAVIKLCGDKLSETIEINFIKTFDPQHEKKMLEYYNTIVKSDNNTKIKMVDLMQNIVMGIKKLKAFEYKDIYLDIDPKIELCCKSVKLTAMIVSIIFMLNEIDFVSPVSIKADMIGREIELQCSVEHKFGTCPIGKIDICKMFPHLPPRMAFINALSEEMNIKNEITISPNSIKTISTIPMDSSKLVKVYADIFAYEQIEQIISALYIPRI